ncbi:hypothetical protein RWE15_06545 [Virgibacillus halophilus]|uniref:Transposase n=1 Tax=Tigheibacillus halophilus TaxID=361280 RepID=A0ABU5C4E6_9BACI|nr:hypothetical protein [Virgibacillus halophilus]
MADRRAASTKYPVVLTIHIHLNYSKLVYGFLPEMDEQGMERNKQW